MRFAPLALILAAGLAPGPRQGDAASERLLQVLERRYREAGDPSDPRAAAGRLGFDRARIVEFVRSEIAWEPYPGVLRDAAGTLLVRGGNSIDRSLLLQAMLEAGGEKTRLMRTDLAEADGAKFLEAFRGRDPKARFSRLQSDPRALAREIGVDEAALEGMVAERRRGDDLFLDEIVEAASAESARLTPLVGAVASRAGVVPREHVFVQVFDLTRRDWMDLEASPVEVPRKGARPVSPPELAGQRRTVTIRLLLNRKSGERIEPVTLLNVPADLSAVSWKAVDFLVQPLPGQLPPLAKLRGLDSKGVLQAFRQVKQYRPGLMIDGRSYGGVPFDLEGRTYDVDAGGRVGPAKALAGGLNKTFGGVLGGVGGGGQAPPASTLESLVLEISVKEPGVAEGVHRRTLLAPPRPGLRELPILRYSFLVDGAPLPPGEFGRREVGMMVRNAAALRKLLQGQLEGVHFNQHVDVPSLLLRFGDLRRRALLRLGEGIPFIQDRPGLVAETSQLVLDEEGGRLLARRGIDILDNPAYLERAADRTLSVGVAETALECLLVERRWPGEARRSAWTLIERARLSGGRPEVSERDGRREVRWSTEAAWNLDPASGSCVGRVPSGAGQGLIEAAWENASAVCTYSDVIGFAAAMGSAGGLTSKEVNDAASLFGKACGVVGGTWPRDAVNDKISEITQGLWTGAINALAGM